VDGSIVRIEMHAWVWGVHLERADGAVRTRCLQVGRDRYGKTMSRVEWERDAAWMSKCGARIVADIRST
jgi:hypothetical protein